MSVSVVSQIYWLDILSTRLGKHLRRGIPYDDDVCFTEVMFTGVSIQFWLEAAICVLHMPPFIESREFSSTFMSNIVVYRLETVGCAGAMLRVYLAWRPFAHWVLKDIPSKHNIASFAEIDFNSTFVIKWMLNSWHAVIYISSAWLCVLIVASYIFRLAEHMHSCALQHHQHPACLKPTARTWSLYGREFDKENDLYYVNSVWFIFTCITPGSGGNVAVATHFGRLVAAVGVICGVLITSLTTAALGNLMIFTTAEHTARGILKRESSRMAYTTAGVNTISLWWRNLKKHEITRNQRKMGLYGYRREFVAAERVLKVELEECASTSTKIEQIVVRTRHMQAVMDKIGINLFISMKHKDQPSFKPPTPPSRPPTQ